MEYKIQNTRERENYDFDHQRSTSMHKRERIKKITVRIYKDTNSQMIYIARECLRMVDWLEIRSSRV